MCTSDFRSAKLTGFRFYRTSIRAERFYICRSEMYHEPAKKTGVNFVNRMDIVQQYEQLPNGNWVLSDDNMTVDLHGVPTKRQEDYK